MNKRIEQLAGQLGPVATIGDWGRVEWADNVYPQLGDKMYAAVDLAKFAESIIEECARKCDVVREYYGGDKQFGARLCADEIRLMNRRS
jgi:hypothetical protein